MWNCVSFAIIEQLRFNICKLEDSRLVNDVKYLPSRLKIPTLCNIVRVESLHPDPVYLRSQAKPAIFVLRGMGFTHKEYKKYLQLIHNYILFLAVATTFPLC